MKFSCLNILTIALGLVVGSGVASANQATEGSQGVSKAPVDSWLILTGTVESIEGDRFSLDYGDHDIIVEMDDWDSYNELLPDFRGKRVTVTGVVDDDFRDDRTIEAHSVYLDGRYYYANFADEESGYYTFPVEMVAATDNWITARGIVKDVGPSSFTLGARTRDIEVDVRSMTDNPLLNEKGEPRIQKGDKVSVYGKFDVLEIFYPQEIRAHSVTVLVPDKPID